MSELNPLRLISERQDRLEQRLAEVEEEAEEIPVLRKEVGLLRDAFDRNTSALYTAAVSLVVTGVLGVLTAVLLKGVIG
jgi:hypothetical protein